MPTEAQIFDPAGLYANLPIVDGRISIAVRELIRLIKTYLPPYIAYVNQQPDVNVPAIQGVRYAGQTLQDTDLDKILIKVKRRAEPWSPGTSLHRWDVQIHSIDERLETLVPPRGVPPSGGHSSESAGQDRAGLIMSLLYGADGEVMTNWPDPQGRIAWKELAFQGSDDLPAQLGGSFRGVALFYLLTQAPGDVNNYI